MAFCAKGGVDCSLIDRVAEVEERLIADAARQPQTRVKTSFTEPAKLHEVLLAAEDLALQMGNEHVAQHLKRLAVHMMIPPGASKVLDMSPEDILTMTLESALEGHPYAAGISSASIAHAVSRAVPSPEMFASIRLYLMTLQPPVWMAGVTGATGATGPTGVTGWAPTCQSCGQEIDPITCWCGELLVHHTQDHAFVPMGCTCYQDPRRQGTTEKTGTSP